MRLAALFVYPVKSLRGLAASSVTVDELGVVGDRRFLVVDATGRFLTQRTLPRMALIEPALTGDSLVLHAPAATGISVPLRPGAVPELRTVSI